MTTATTGLLVATAVLAALAWVNVAHRRLPDRISLPGAVLTAAALGVDAVRLDDPGLLVDGLAGGAGAFALLYVVELALPPGQGLGFGTVKSATVLGLGAGSLGLVAFAAGVGALIAGAFLVLAGAALISRGQRSAPTGPVLLAALTVAVVVGRYG